MRTPSRNLVWLASLGAIAACLAGSPVLAAITVTEINPIQSSLHPTNANGGSGGRVQNVAADPHNSSVYYAASEWGGLYKSVDRGRNWDRLDGFLPTAAWAVAVHPTNSQIVVATALFDGRVNSLAGVLRSADGGATWTRPASVTPPAGACIDARAERELSGFGVAFDRSNANRVYAATNCGLAASTDAGATWTYINPTGTGGARTLFDVIVHGNGIVDVCGNIGHRRSTNAGGTWTGPTATGNPLPAGMCSLAVSPHEGNVLFATSGVSIFESDDGGGTWGGTYANPAQQGRIPFVATNRTGTASFDLWFGDVGLFRAACSRPASGVGNRCPASGTWVNVGAGAHADAGSLAFDPQPPAQKIVDPACRSECVDERRDCMRDGLRPSACATLFQNCLKRCDVTLRPTTACPVLFSSDGGVYRNTNTTNPACQTPSWNQPDRTPRSLWLWNLSGARLSAAGQEELYMLAQDNGAIGSRTAATTPPSWNHSECCDGFGSGAQPNQVVYSLGVFTPAPGVRLFLRNGGMTGGALLPVASQPPGGIVSFNFGKSIAWVEGNVYVVLTGNGLQRTANITAATVAWTQLGNLPAAGCSVSVSRDSGQVAFFVQTGNCGGSGADRVFRYDGQAAGGAWNEIAAPVITTGVTSRFAVFAVDPNNRQRFFAAVVSGTDIQMFRSTNGGTSWTRVPALETLMNGNGQFLTRTALGPTGFSPNLSGYAQPTLLAFSPLDGNTVVAGAYDAGVFLSRNGGTTWSTLTNNSGGSANPVIPRPRTAHFEVDGTVTRVFRVYIGTQGRGAWRIVYDQETTSTSCADECRADRDDCMADAGQPGNPTKAQCAQRFQACIRACGSRGCSASQKCCEPGADKCLLCRPRNAACP